MKYTVRSLMEKVNMTYNNSYEVIRKMREKGLVQDVKKTNGVGVMNAKQYTLLMDPVEFLNEEREKSPPPPEGFFNNPFNLKNAEDLRIQKWREA
jgi:hypothetical protein